MPAFSSLIGKRVEVSYRVGEIHLAVTGNLSLDSGQCIRIEDRYSRSGREKTIRLEIPYSSIVRVREVAPPVASSPLGASASLAKP